MSRNFYLTILLFSVAVLFACGISDPTIEQPIDDEVELESTLTKKGLASFGIGNLVRITPVQENFHWEIVKRTKNKVFTKIYGIRGFVHSNIDKKSSHLFEGNIISITIVQEKRGNKLGQSKLLDIEGNVVYREVTDVNTLIGSNGLAKSSEGDSECTKTDLTTCESYGEPPDGWEWFCNEGTCDWQPMEMQ